MPNVAVLQSALGCVQDMSILSALCVHLISTDGAMMCDWTALCHGETLFDMQITHQSLRCDED